jgi:hypothetical protein
MKFTVIMSDKQTDKLDAFTSKMVKESPVEKPSIDFSKNVMDAIYELETEKVVNQYEPLISKKVWALMAMVIVLISVWLWKNTTLQSSGLFAGIDLSNYTHMISIEIPNFTVSSVTLYAFVFLAIMVFFQIGFIKNYYNRRFD